MRGTGTRPPRPCQARARAHIRHARPHRRRRAALLDRPVAAGPGNGILSRQFRLRLERREGFRPETFIPSPANVQARQALAAWPAWHGGCLVLVGPAGAGKSHLAQVWAKRVGAQVLTPAAAVDLRALEGGPALLEDADAGALGEDLFHLINMAAGEGGGLLMTARTRPALWPTSVGDLRSRLNALQVAEIDEPDDAILQAGAAEAVPGAEYKARGRPNSYICFAASSAPCPGR